MSTPPDRSCRTGGDGGLDVYIWTCHEGKHTVISKYTWSFGCQEPEKEIVPCGQQTSIERQLGTSITKDCRLPPEVCRWP